MKNKYAIINQEGDFYHGDFRFYTDAATLFSSYEEAQQKWESLPYRIAVRSEIVELQAMSIAK